MNKKQSNSIEVAVGNINIGAKNPIRIQSMTDTDTANLKATLNQVKSLIDAYDNHNIVVLPSFTEGQPYILDECLSRERPIVIFEDIAYVVKDRKGVFVSKRDTDSFIQT